MLPTVPARDPIARQALIAMALVVASAACGTAPQPSAPGLSDSSASRVAIGGVEWFVDYDAALAIAREQDKALWVHFGENPG